MLLSGKEKEGKNSGMNGDREGGSMKAVCVPEGHGKLEQRANERAWCRMGAGVPRKCVVEYRKILRKRPEEERRIDSDRARGWSEKGGERQAFAITVSWVFYLIAPKRVTSPCRFLFGAVLFCTCAILKCTLQLPSQDPPSPPQEARST